MRRTLHLKTTTREEMIDISPQVRAVVAESGIQDGLVAVYAMCTSGAVMIQENWDPTVPTDMLNFLRKLLPKGVWLHDAIDGNGDAHLKAALLGPSQTIPIVDGQLGLSRWQHVFFCEFDGPRDRQVMLTLLRDED